jgi:hypothetical protein
MIHTILDAIEFILEDQGEPQSPDWLASQIMELRLWRASEQGVRTALERDIGKFGERSPFVRTTGGEYALRKWSES